MRAGAEEEIALAYDNAVEIYENLQEQSNFKHQEELFSFFSVISLIFAVF